MKQAALAAMLIFALGLFLPASANDADALSLRAVSARETLLEYAETRGAVDGCTGTRNEVDFQDLIDRTLDRGGSRIWRFLSPQKPDTRAELQTEVNAAYRRGFVDRNCTTAIAVVVQAERAEALRSALVASFDATD